jgi:chaperone modulatory protein CbpM
MQTLGLDWLDQVEPVTLSDLSRLTDMNDDEITELMEYGAIAPLQPGDGKLLFPGNCISLIRTASKLRRTYDMELFAVVVLIDYLRRIEHLEQQVHTLQVGIKQAGTV